MKESAFDEMKRYLRFDDADTSLLRAFLPIAAPHLGSIVEAFYERIREFDGAHAVLIDEAQVGRLKQSLLGWMTRSLEGPHDARFFDEASRIGQVHARIGLAPRYVFTSMSLLRSALGTLIDGELGERARATRDALMRLLDLQLAIIDDAYDRDSLERRAAAERFARDEQTRHDNLDIHRSAVEHAPALIVGLDSAGTIRLFNDAAERLTGFDRAEVVGRDYARSVLAEGLFEEHASLFRSDALAAGTTRVVESAVRTRSGKIREVRWSISYLGSQEREASIFAVGEDQTDTNERESQTRRTEKLAALGRLSAGLAHELRNPLNGARLHVTLLQRNLQRLGVADAETVETVGVVSSEIERLGKLVDEFLVFARPKPLSRAKVALATLCERAVADTRPTAARSGIHVELDLPSNALDVVVDAVQLEQTLVSLIENAIEAAASGSRGKVTVRARRRPRTVSIEVEDNGPGVSPPDAPIFDAFFSTKPSGTGMGLAIAHRVVDEHGGALTFTSRPGETRFSMVLPIEAA